MAKESEVRRLKDFTALLIIEPTLGALRKT